MEPFIHSGDVIAIDVSKNKLDLVKMEIIGYQP